MAGTAITPIQGPKIQYVNPNPNPGGGFGFVDAVVTLQAPVNKIIFGGAIGANSIRIFISLAPTGGVLTGAGTLNIFGTEHWIPLVSNNASLARGQITFARPVSQFYVSADNGGALAPDCMLVCTNDVCIDV